MSSFAEPAPRFNPNPSPSQTSFPHFSQVRTEVNQFSRKADHLANQILAPKDIPYEGPVIIRERYYISPFYTPWYYPSHSYYVVGRQGRGRDNGDNAARLVIGILATIGVFVMAKAVGDAVVAFKDSQRELNETDAEKEKLNNLSTVAKPEDQAIIAQANDALELKERICSRIRNSAVWDLALSVSLTAGLALTAIGAFVCPPLALAGIALTVVAATSIMFKWGFDSRDSENQRDAHDLKARVAGLKEL